jgi:hypothetical protein
MFVDAWNMAKALLMRDAVKDAVAVLVTLILAAGYFLLTRTKHPP